MTPFRAPQLNEEVECPETVEARRDYNYCISQLRIRSEMGLGFMVNKWRIFHRPLAMSVDNVRRIIMTCFRLHNFVIDRALLNHGPTEGRRWVDANSTCNEYSCICDSGEDHVDVLRSDLAESHTGSELREALVKVIEAAEIIRPR
eukprot:GHVU01035194.1.p3 GENE.GHVU01035194.1~~GHVU01035194.1.p3  ORF type:complete len:146 (-),score=12.18 GHVU01035194.1:301-738(-)